MRREIYYVFRRWCSRIGKWQLRRVDFHLGSIFLLAARGADDGVANHKYDPHNTRTCKCEFITGGRTLFAACISFASAAVASVSTNVQFGISKCTSQIDAKCARGLCGEINARLSCVFMLLLLRALRRAWTFFLFPFYCTDRSQITHSRGEAGKRCAKTDRER